MLGFLPVAWAMAFRLMVVLAAVPIADMASKDPPVSKISRLVGVAFSVMPISPFFGQAKQSSSLQQMLDTVRPEVLECSVEIAV
ncbi:MULTISPECIES: hypothetical protein [Rhizobium]|nr:MULTISPECIES: hypothetical protein [Rhizobium]WSG91345.1 hypothetical protein U8P73_11110 [Rhizobium beringeri]